MGCEGGLIPLVGGALDGIYLFKWLPMLREREWLPMQGSRATTKDPNI